MIIKNAPISYGYFKLVQEKKVEYTLYKRGYMKDKKNTTNAKHALILSGISNTISAVIHLAIVIAFVLFAVKCFKSDPMIFDLVNPLIGGFVGESVAEIVTPLALRIAFLVLLFLAMFFLLIFIITFSVAVDCYSNSRKEPKEAYKCRKGIRHCGTCELFGAIIFIAIGVGCFMLPNFLPQAIDYADYLQIGLTTFAVIGGLLFVSAIVKYCAAASMGREKRRNKRNK